MSLTVKIKYIGQSNSRFKKDQIYIATQGWGEKRGWKSDPLDWLILSDGYRIMPFEERKFWQILDPLNYLLRKMYGRPGEFSMADIVYSTNPFLSLIPKNDSFKGHYIPVPLKFE